MARIVLLLVLFAITSPAHARAGDVAVAPFANGRAGAQPARASYYGFESGARTANGERFHPHALTCAHRTLPFNTRVRVTYRGRSVICRVNDRGPAKWTRRSIDLSLGAALAIGLIRAGHGPVLLEVMP